MVNMWEIDGMVKTGRRKAPAGAGSKKVLEVHLPESLSKLITSIRKYLLFYLKLLEETGDVNTLDRAHASIRGDKRIWSQLPLEGTRELLYHPYDQMRKFILLVKALPSRYSRKCLACSWSKGSLWSEVCNLPRANARSSLRALFMGNSCFN